MYSRDMTSHLPRALRMAGRSLQTGAPSLLRSGMTGPKSPQQRVPQWETFL